jgi:hypothetical protein
MKQQTSEALSFINEVLKDHLSPKNNFKGKKFTGCMTFTISCTDGGISNVDASISKHLKKSGGK